MNQEITTPDIRTFGPDFMLAGPPPRKRKSSIYWWLKLGFMLVTLGLTMWALGDVTRRIPYVIPVQIAYAVFGMARMVSKI